MNRLLLRFSRAGVKLCRERGLDEQLIDFEAFYDYGISYHENKQLLIARINSLARQFKTGDAREAVDSFRDFYSEPRNNPNSLYRFLEGRKM